MWINYGVHGVNGLTLSALQTLTSGLPYGAVGPMATQRSFVTNPGYVTPSRQHRATAINYYFTARDAFRTDGERRTDFSASYNYALPREARARWISSRSCRLLNVFNQFQDMCGCGTVFRTNGGAVHADPHRPERADQRR